MLSNRYGRFSLCVYRSWRCPHGASLAGFYLRGYRSLSPERMQSNGSENWVHLVGHLLAKCKQPEIGSSPITGPAASKNNPVAQQLWNPAGMCCCRSAQGSAWAAWETVITFPRWMPFIKISYSRIHFGLNKVQKHNCLFLHLTMYDPGERRMISLPHQESWIIITGGAHCLFPSRVYSQGNVTQWKQRICEKHYCKLFVFLHAICSSDYPSVE